MASAPIRSICVIRASSFAKIHIPKSIADKYFCFDKLSMTFRLLMTFRFHVQNPLF